MLSARITIPCLTALFAGLMIASYSPAAEKRCTELGVNCVCSEPLNTTNFVPSVYGPTWLNPADSTTKQCTAEEFNDPAATGAAITQNFGVPVVYGDNNATALAALPAGHQISYFLREGSGNVSAWHITHMQKPFNAGRTEAAQALFPNGGTVTTGARTEHIEIKRAAVRFYVYRSADYDFNTENGGQCQNSKIGQIDTLIFSHIQPPKIAAYNFMWGGWTPARSGVDCCGAGPYNAGEMNGPASSADWKGKWWRYEFVTSNRLGAKDANGNVVGPGYRMQGFIKNITDPTWNAGQEARILDTNGTITSPVGWAPSPTDLTPGQFIADGPVFPLAFSLGLYRAVTCRGWAGVSHFMAAQWSTDTGQRIGAAYEIEGGGSLPSTPSAVPNLRIR